MRIHGTIKLLEIILIQTRIKQHSISFFLFQFFYHGIFDTWQDWGTVWQYYFLVRVLVLKTVYTPHVRFFSSWGFCTLIASDFLAINSDIPVPWANYFLFSNSLFVVLFFQTKYWLNIWIDENKLLNWYSLVFLINAMVIKWIIRSRLIFLVDNGYWIRISYQRW